MKREERAVLLFLVGSLGLVVAVLYMPRCADIPQFSYTCLAPWLPFMAPLIALGAVALFFGVRAALPPGHGGA